MTFESILDRASADIFAQLGRAATFTPATGSAVSCTVVLDVGVRLQTDGYTGQASAQVTTVEGLVSEIGREPNRNETFLIGSTTYTVQSTLENDGRHYKVTVK